MPELRRWRAVAPAWLRGLVLGATAAGARARARRPAVTVRRAARPIDAAAAVSDEEARRIASMLHALVWTLRPLVGGRMPAGWRCPVATCPVHYPHGRQRPVGSGAPGVARRAR